MDAFIGNQMHTNSMGKTSLLFVVFVVTFEMEPPSPNVAKEINNWYRFHPTDSFDLHNLDDNE